MNRAVELLAHPVRAASAAAAVLRSFAQHIGMLLTEHATALRAAERAARHRQRRDDLRAVYADEREF
jgi:hypothetical protein